MDLRVELNQQLSHRRDSIDVAMLCPGNAPFVALPEPNAPHSHIYPPQTSQHASLHAIGKYSQNRAIG